ncbi:MAG TPA: hypothetical protein VIW92_07895 [Thermoanaerobaculia bacterium]
MPVGMAFLSDGFRRWWSGLFSPASSEETGEQRGGRWTRLAFRITLGAGSLAILIYAAQETPLNFLKLASQSLLIALGALLAGTLLGFLFGIPRTLSQPPAATPAERTSPEAAAEEQEDRTAARTEYQGNTNLEQISDWLTKIIVGLALVQFEHIKTFIKNLVAYLATGLGSAPAYGPYVLTLLVLFAVCGFFIGYLLTRLYLGLALLRSDLESRRMTTKLEKIQAQVQQVREKADRPELQSMTRSLEANQDLQNGIREQIRLLADEYENIRKTMAPGNDRTRRMELVASQMRTLANMGAPLLPELTLSPSAGERLAAVTFLQVHPKLGYLDWLAERVAQERPFIGYHAAVALLYAARMMSADALPAIRKARTALGARNANTDRGRTLERAEQVAESSSY